MEALIDKLLASDRELQETKALLAVARAELGEMRERAVADATSAAILRTMRDHLRYYPERMAWMIDREVVMSESAKVRDWFNSLNDR